MTEKIKECPFCAAYPSIFTGNFTTISCENSLCEVNPSHDNYRSEDNAIKIWNTRALLQPSLADAEVQKSTELNSRLENDREFVKAARFNGEIK